MAQYISVGLAKLSAASANLETNYMSFKDNSFHFDYSFVAETVLNQPAPVASSLIAFQDGIPLNKESVTILEIMVTHSRKVFLRTGGAPGSYISLNQIAGTPLPYHPFIVLFGIGSLNIGDIPPVAPLTTLRQFYEANFMTERLYIPERSNSSTALYPFTSYFMGTQQNFINICLVTSLEGMTMDSTNLEAQVISDYANYVVAGVQSATMFDYFHVHVSGKVNI